VLFSFYGSFRFFWRSPLRLIECLEINSLVDVLLWGVTLPPVIKGFLLFMLPAHGCAAGTMNRHGDVRTESQHERTGWFGNGIG